MGVTSAGNQVIFRNDRFWHLLLSSIMRTEDTLSAVSVAAGFGPISFMSEEWRSNPARVEAARLSSVKGGVTSATNSAATAVTMQDSVVDLCCCLCRAKLVRLDAYETIDIRVLTP